MINVVVDIMLDIVFGGDIIEIHSALAAAPPKAGNIYL